MKSRKRPPAARAIRFSVQEAMQRSPQPFAIARGAEHTLVYANSAFCRLAGIADGEAPQVPIATVFTAVEGGALGALLDRASGDRVELLDERLDSSSERASRWQCTVWPVITDDGRAETLGIQIRESIPPDDALDLKRQGAAQMLPWPLAGPGV